MIQWGENKTGANISLYTVRHFGYVPENTASKLIDLNV